jgi:hypothetical protein
VQKRISFRACRFGEGMIFRCAAAATSKRAQPKFANSVSIATQFTQDPPAPSISARPAEFPLGRILS